jgi:hypothetical protein
MAQIGALLICAVVGLGVFALIPDREISDSEYVEVAQAVARCPDAQSALDRINKDHKILQSEKSDLLRIIEGYVEQDERVTRAQNVMIAKGLAKGPLHERTCVAAAAPEPIKVQTPKKK